MSKRWWMRSRGELWAIALALLLTGCRESEEEGAEVVMGRYEALLSSEREQTPEESIVARVGTSGVVTREAFEREWSLSPELSREQVLEVLVRRELLLDALSGEMSPDEALIEALRLAQKRGMVDAMIQEDISQGRGEQDTFTIEGLTPEQVDAVVQREVDRLSSPAGYDASHLLVRVPQDADESRWEKGLEVAREIARALDAMEGARLPAMTRYVLDSNGKHGGFELAVNGHLKFPTRREEGAVLEDGFIQVVAEFSQAAAKLHVERGLETLSDPVRTPFGWHLIVVHERFAPRGPGPDEVRAALMRTHEEQRARSVLLQGIEPLYGHYNWSTDPAALEDELDVAGTNDTNTQERESP